MVKDNNKNSGGLSKVDALLKQMGISEEARKEFISVCESWHGSEKDKFKKEYEIALNKAKKVCLEETEAHKAALSRGVQLFLEKQLDNIHKASEKQMAIAEPEAVNLLKKVKSVMSGIDIDGAANAQALQAESKKNALLVQKISKLEESLERERAKAAKLGELTEKAISRQKSLEKDLHESKLVLGEARKSLESRETSKAIFEEKSKGGKPKTTRSVISESDKIGRGKQSGSVDDIDLIAEGLE